MVRLGSGDGLTVRPRAAKTETVGKPAAVTSNLQVSPAMAKSSPRAADGLPVRRQFLPVVLLLFVGSGCAALIYEIVWLQMLQLVIGSTAVSLGVLLGTFMGGMCLGSLLLPRLVSNKRHPWLSTRCWKLALGWSPSWSGS